MSKRLASAAELEERLTALQDKAWDSDEDQPQETIEVPKENMSKKKKKRKLNANSDEMSSVLYIGHIPHGFYEQQMKGFFSQFGEVTRVRLSRSKKTGGSKGYAFIEFQEREVAAVVADSMDKYILSGKQLVVKQLTRKMVHPKMWKGVDEKFRRFPVQEQIVAKHNKERTLEQQARLTQTLLKREERKRKELERLGIEYEFPGFKAHAEEVMNGESTSESKEAPKKPSKKTDVVKPTKKAPVEKVKNAPVEEAPVKKVKKAPVKVKKAPVEKVPVEKSKKAPVKKAKKPQKSQ